MSKYVISDTHFGDKNILTAFNRPFDSVEEMDKELIERWNETVTQSDTVYVVGDFTVAKKESAVLFRLEQLNGTIQLVDGNHRPIPRSKFEQSDIPIQRFIIFEYSGYHFHLAHKPEWIPPEWDGWSITGHYHDKLDQHPFVDSEKRIVNVAVELIKYQPLSLDKLVKILETGQQYTVFNDVDQSL